MDVWCPARVHGQGRERYFLLVVDDYSRYTTVFPLHCKGGGEFSSDLLRAFCRLEGIRQTFTLPASPQKNGIAERRIGMVMDVARTSMIHAAAPHFLWPFAVQYAAHQINLQPRVSLREISPTLRWMGKVGDASAFRDVTFDESVPYYRLFPYRTAPLPPPPLFLASGPPQVDPLPPQGPAPSGVSQVDAEPGGAESGSAEPGVAEPGGAGSGGGEPERAEPWGAASGGADPGAARSGGVELAGAGPGGPSGALSRRELPSPQELREWFTRRWSRARAGGAASVGGSAATGGAGAARSTGAGPGGSTSAGGAGAAGPGGSRTGGPGAAGSVSAPSAGAGGAAGVGATGGTGAGPAVSAGGPTGAGAAGGTGAGGAAGVGADAWGAGVDPAGSRGASRPRPYFVPLLEHVLGLPRSSGPAPSLEFPPPVQSESQIQLASPLPTPSPYAGPTSSLAERCAPESRPASPVRTARTSRRVPRPLPPVVPGTHQMTLRPSTAPQRVPLPSPPASSLPALADPASDSLRAVSPIVTRLLATVVTDPSFESTAASALVTELVDFAAHCHHDFATSLVAESASVCPLSVGDPDAPDIPTPRSYAEAIEGPYSSQWQAAMDAEMASWKSTGTYVDEVPPPGTNICWEELALPSLGRSRLGGRVRGRCIRLPSTAKLPTTGSRRLTSTWCGHKSDAARVIIEEWLPMVERESGKRVKAIRSDRGGEFLGEQFRSWLKRHGIKQHLTTAYSPQSNGVAERANRTIIEGERTILVDSGLPLRFWPLAVRHAIVIKNRVLTHVGGQHWVPKEKWSGKKPLVDMLHVFRCMGLVHVSKEKSDKLQAATVWAVHLGLARGSKGWLMWDPKSNTIFTTKDAKFMEGLMFKEWSERGRSKVTIPLGIEAADVEAVLQQGEAPVAERGDTKEEVQQPIPSPKLPPRRITQGKRDAVRGGAKERAARERPKRAARPGDFLEYERLGGPKALLVHKEEDEEEKGAEGEMEQICCFGVNLPPEPTSMEEALAEDDREAWKDEFKSHMEIETWTLTNLPPGRKALDSTWVLRVKTNAEGKLERRKTRLLIKGFQQREWIDFQEVFAPVAKAPTL
ncbi:unnamed protein product [Closterium sp. NIES-54]